MTGRFDLRDTTLSDVKVLERSRSDDNRGFIERLFSVEELSTVMGPRAIVQINRSLTSRQGTVRGLHFQLPPHAELKLVTCLRGRVFDVAVDLRRDSPTFLQWHAEILSGTEARTIVVPEGFAHGFQTLVADCEMLYMHTAGYDQEAERGIDPRDPLLSIAWPVQIAEMSTRDASHPRLADDYRGVVL